jgi:parallel beta-helix repeat protein
MKQYITAAILLLATLTCACTAAGATQLYVNETGWWIDPAQFNSSSTPIQSAINNATDSDLIYVHNGSYNENVNVNKRLTLVGEGREVVTVTASSAYSNIFYVNRDYVNISGFTVTGVTGSGSGIYLSHADHCNISDNNASGNYYGIYLSSSSNNNITNNRANSNNRNGICISYSNSNTVCKNTVGLNMHTGILLISSSCYNDLYDNTIHNNSNGFWFYEPSCDHNRIHGNRVFDHIGDHGSITSQNRHAIRLYDASCNQVYNNTVYSNYNSISIWSRSDYNEVFDNNVTNNTVGITVSGHTDHFCRYNDIHDNHVELSRASGIEVISLDGYNSIYNNTLHANDRSGIRLENHAAVDFVYNNTIDSSGWYGIEVSWNNNSQQLPLGHLHLPEFVQ